LFSILLGRYSVIAMGCNRYHIDEAKDVAEATNEGEKEGRKVLMNEDYHSPAHNYLQFQPVLGLD
jgi:hypothetical protein